MITNWTWLLWVACLNPRGKNPLGTPIPVEFPQSEPLVTLVIGDEWLALIQGILYRMLNRNYWDNPTDEEFEVIKNKVGFAMDLLATNADVGTFKFHILESAPSNWLPCLGQTLQKSDYPTLYGKIHPSFRINANQFVLPDMSNRFIKIKAGGSNYGDTGGSKLKALTVDNLPAHHHAANTGLNGSPFFIGQSNGGGQAVKSQLVPQSTATDTRVTAFPNTADTGEGEPFNNEPEYVVIGVLIVAS